jgi:hypothetical protein
MITPTFALSILKLDEYRYRLRLQASFQELSRQLKGEDWIPLFSRQLQSPGEKSHTATRLGTADQEYDLGLCFQSNKLTSGEALQSGNTPFLTQNCSVLR